MMHINDEKLKRNDFEMTRNTQKSPLPPLQLKSALKHRDMVLIAPHGPYELRKERTEEVGENEPYLFMGSTRMQDLVFADFK